MKRMYLLLTFLLSFYATSTWAGAMTGQVIKILDGDTFVLSDTDNTEHHIRILGIDAPEKDQKYGDEATDSLKQLIYGEDVTVTDTKSDQYGRTLGRVLANGQDAGLEQIKRGMAWSYKASKSKKFTGYSEAQKEAKASQIGLWQDAKPKAPSRWRHRAKRTKEE